MENSKIREIAQQYETPLYIYDKKKIESNYNELKASIFPGARLFYSMKANPLVGICQIFKNLQAGIETASMGEMYVALQAGFLPENIIFTSPGKTREELKYALAKKIKLINIESFREAQMISEIAKKLGIIAKIGIRVNPAVCYSNAKIKMTGVSSQFGIEEEQLTQEFFDKISKLENLEIQGIQIYMGTQLLLAEDIVKNTEYAMKLAVSLSERYGFKLRYLNVGGGFGVKYFKNETPLDLVELKEKMNELHKQLNGSLKDTEVIFESGRFLMANTGEFVTKVLYTKESKGQKYVVCDGGSNFHSSAAFLGRFVRNNFPLHTIPEGEQLTEATVCGPLCTPLDVIGQKVSINSDIDENHLVVIEMSGAYGYTYSPCRFLSHEQPYEILVDGEEIKVLRNRSNAQEYMNGQNIL